MKKKKVCLLTGASGTIGYAIAKALKKSSSPSVDWHIIIIGRREPPLSLTHPNHHHATDNNNNDDDNPSSIVVLPYDTFLQVSDMTNEDIIHNTLNSHFDTLSKSEDVSIRSLNRLDLLINCAGTGEGGGPIESVSADTFRHVLEINLVLPYIMSRWAFIKFASNNNNDNSGDKGGRIINIGSVACESPRLNAIPYTTSKYALTGLTECLSIQGRFFHNNDNSGVNGMVAVCQINPGNVRSDIIGPDEMARREKEEGFVEPEDVGNMVALVANMDNGVNCLECKVMPTRMPLVGRG